jgi:hypothetical protein
MNDLILHDAHGKHVCLLVQSTEHDPCGRSDQFVSMFASDARLERLGHERWER